MGKAKGLRVNGGRSRTVKGGLPLRQTPFRTRDARIFLTAPLTAPQTIRPVSGLQGAARAGGSAYGASLRLGSNWQNIGRLENGGRQPLGGMTAEDFAFEGDGVARGLSSGPRFFCG